MSAAGCCWGSTQQYAEAFEISEYGRRPTDAERDALARALVGKRDKRDADGCRQQVGEVGADQCTHAAGNIRERRRLPAR